MKGEPIEQLGLFGGEVTPKSDIYSLGLVLASAMKGEPIDMGGTQVEVIEKRRHVPDLTGVDPHILPLLSAMLQPDPADRPDSMAVVCDWAIRIEEEAGLGGAPAPIPTPLTAETPNVAIERSVPRKRRTSMAHTTSRAAAKPAEKKRGGAFGLVTILLLLLMAGSGGTYYFYGDTLIKDFLGEETKEDDAPPSLVPTQPKVDDGKPRLTPRPSPIATGDDDDTADNSSSESNEEIASSGQSGNQQRPEVIGTGEEPKETAADQVNRAAALKEAVETFTGGACFYVRVVEVSNDRITVEGFGSSQDPFIRLETAIKDTFGVEPKIDVRPISQEQCHVASFLTQLRPYEKLNPKLELFDDRITGSEKLPGAVTDISDDALSLFMVANNGVVYNLGPLMTRRGERAEFNVDLGSKHPPDPYPHLVLAVVNSGHIDMLQFNGEKYAARYFPALFRTMKDSGVPFGTAVKFFSLGGQN